MTCRCRPVHKRARHPITRTAATAQAGLVAAPDPRRWEPKEEELNGTREMSLQEGTSGSGLEVSFELRSLGVVCEPQGHHTRPREELPRMLALVGIVLRQAPMEVIRGPYVPSAGTRLAFKPIQWLPHCRSSFAEAAEDILHSPSGATADGRYRTRTCDLTGVIRAF